MPSSSSTEVSFAPHPVAGAALFGSLDALAPAEGINTLSSWAGLTIHRFSETAPTHRIEFSSLSIGFSVYRDRSAVYILASGGAKVGVHTATASTRRPVLHCTVPIDPQLVRSISADLHKFSVVGSAPDPDDGPTVSTLGGDLLDTLVGFLGALSHSGDRRILAPLRMQELVYRLLRHDQRTRLSQLAANELLRNPVAAALGHIAGHLAEPLTVEALAVHVSMSPSAFSRVFREATGQPPYQYIKGCRLDRARDLLDDRGLGVSAVALAVGYSSVSHFIKEFRGRFGSTPGEYADKAQQRDRVNPALH
ncbi:helix-turn-helix domain-containing protein [Mycolicibacterium sp. Dal123E01]|uniref:helix-turn-helix domain-containing protein n=1 Tax=Mycolicibacterium sp. Dal123E01 TaxID=3457578 RepID=UPI00403E9FAA